MTVEQVMAELEARGTTQNRRVYARHGVKEPMFGVSFGNLRELAKNVRRDHALARALWSTGNHDARVFATMVADPAAGHPDELDRWAADLDNYVVADAFATLVRKSPHAVTMAEGWTGRKEEWVARAGWALLTHLAQDRPELEDDALIDKLEQIKTGIHGAPNYARHAMNMALIAIGGRSETLRQEAVATAKQIGRVKVDHGETGCQTPDAIPYIAKIWERRAKQSR